MRLLIAGLVFATLSSAAELMVFRTPAELLPMFFHDGIYGNNDVVTACVFGESGTKYLLTMIHGDKSVDDFGHVDQYGRYCKVYTFPVSERQIKTTFTAQELKPVGEPLKPQL